MDDTKGSAAGALPLDGEEADRPTTRERPSPTLTERLRAAQAALAARLRISIRVRLVASLALCFLLCAAFALGSFQIMRGLRLKLHLAQTLERLDDRILRVRALADEGILSREDLEGVLARAKEAQSLLGAERFARQPETRDLLEHLLRHVDACQRVLAAHGGEQGKIITVSAESAGELRVTAAEASRRLHEMNRQQRHSIERILRLAETGPLALLALLLVLFGAIIFAFTHALARPIRRFKGYTTRIAQGDFSFIRPARRYRDEFTDLAMAVNQMLAELRTQQDRVVKGAKLAAVGTLTSGIAHEINNPLNNISITTEALMEGLQSFSDEEKWRHLQDIYFETERASEIVKSLLDFTRKERPDTELVDLQEVLHSTIRLVQNEMAINNVSLTSEIPADMPTVLGAPNPFRQVFLNLLLNAIQAMPGGGSIRVRANLHAAERVCVDISDTGPGIPADVLPRIFDPFFTTKEPGKGTGLGLSTSLGIVRKFGGDIHVTSEPGHGTLFHVCLPRAGAR
jgi:two-component system NtrC family sensor kinase